jgi:hypothetical protein
LALVLSLVVERVLQVRAMRRNRTETAESPRGALAVSPAEPMIIARVEEV